LSAIIVSFCCGLIPSIKRVCLGAFCCGGDRPAIFGRHFQNFFHALVGGEIEEFLCSEIRLAAFFAAAGLPGVWGLGAASGDGASPVSTAILCLPGGRTAFGCFVFVFAVLLVFIALELRFVNRALRGILRQRGFSVGDLLDQWVGREIFYDLFCSHTERTERSQPGIERRLVNFIGMEFEFDPLVNADLRDALHIAGPRTEGQPVQGVDGAFPGVHRHCLAGGGLVFFPAESELGRQAGCHEQRRYRQQTASRQRRASPDWPHL
jgi:hypothetical protein